MFPFVATLTYHSLDFRVNTSTCKAMLPFCVCVLSFSLTTSCEYKSIMLVFFFAFLPKVNWTLPQFSTRKVLWRKRCHCYEVFRVSLQDITINKFFILLRALEGSSPKFCCFTSGEFIHRLKSSLTSDVTCMPCGWPKFIEPRPEIYQSPTRLRTFSRPWHPRHVDPRVLIGSFCCELLTRSVGVRALLFVWRLYIWMKTAVTFKLLFVLAVFNVVWMSLTFFLIGKTLLLSGTAMTRRTSSSLNR